VASRPRAWRDLVLALLLAHTTTATAFIWLVGRPSLRVGLLQTLVVWSIAAVGLLGRLGARQQACRLSAIAADRRIAGARAGSAFEAEQAGLRLRHASAWLVFVLGAAATAIVWRSGEIVQLLGWEATLGSGLALSLAIALAVAANAANRLKARRLARDLRGAMESGRAAHERLAAIDVMTSVCLPSGQRTGFNDNFLKFLGMTAAQAEGRGWLEAVHPQDRQAALDIVAPGPQAGARIREHDLCVRRTEGEFVLLHETLVPRCDEAGELIEFVSTAVDATRWTASQSLLEKQFGEAKAELARAQTELAEARAGLGEAQSELTAAKATRSRLEGALAESREEAKSLRAALTKAEAGVAAAKSEAAERIREVQTGAKERVRAIEEAAAERIRAAEEGAQSRAARIEESADSRIARAQESADARIARLEEAAKAARQDHELAVSENKTLKRAFEKLGAELAERRQQDGQLREQIAAHVEEALEAEARAAEARRAEEKQRGALEQQRDRCAALEAQLASSKSAAEAAAAERARQAEAAAQERVSRMEAAAEERVARAQESADGRIARLEDAVKSARRDHEQAVTENRSLTQAFEKLRAEMSELRQQDLQLREQIASHLKETREADSRVAEAEKSEEKHRLAIELLRTRCAELEEQLGAAKASAELAVKTSVSDEHRAELDRLTRRCAELEGQLATREASLAAAEERARQALETREKDRRLREDSSEALATQFRRQLDVAQRMIGELLATTRDGPVQDAARNAAATVRSMCDLAEQSLQGAAAGANGAAQRLAATETARPETFEIRRTVQGVRDLLAKAAEAKGVKVEVETAAGVPALVRGSEIEIRTALVSLAEAALGLVEDGTLMLRLSEDVSTAAHSTLRCELSHASARVKCDALEAAMAIASTEAAMPDATKNPGAHRAAKAWGTIRSLQGQHGFQLPDVGGFSIWFTFTLERPAGAAPGEEAPLEPDASRPPPRVPQEFLSCNLGEVVELGAESMRVYCPRPPKASMVTVTFDGEELERGIRAIVTWSRKLTARKHDVGLKLVDLTQAEQQQLQRIAMQHRRVTRFQEVA
jgi:PAS domain S-box-containing protein